MLTRVDDERLEADERPPNDLVLSLHAVRRTQALWLADLDQVCQGELGFLAVFHRWEEQLTALKLHLHRAEARLLHFVMASAITPHRDFPAGTIDRRLLARAWIERIGPWFRSIHIDTAYRRLDHVLDLDVEAITADIATDLATVAETAERTMPALAALRAGAGDPASLPDLAFFHVLAPWRSHGLDALADVLRWLGEVIHEHEDW